MKINSLHVYGKSARIYFNCSDSWQSSTAVEKICSRMCSHISEQVVQFLEMPLLGLKQEQQSLIIPHGNLVRAKGNELTIWWQYEHQMLARGLFLVPGPF